MFGYAIANFGDLSEDERQRYQSTYCGLCRALGQRHGQLSRFSLTYDMTFLILLLNSLYEPEEQAGQNRCVVHPVKKRLWTHTPFTDYAADLTVCLTYFKCADDWQDERKWTGRAYMRLLEKRYQEVRRLLPRQCAVIERSLGKLNEQELWKGSADEASKCFGRLMAELFVRQEDAWSGPLRQFGYSLGCFLYLMDAALDFEEDVKTGRYNPVFTSGKQPGDMEEPLRIMIGRAADVFERLPLVQDIHLLRSVLYAGVWQKWNARQSREADQRE